MAALFHRLLARVRAMFQVDALDRDLEDELAAHVRMRADDHLRGGLTPEEAHRAALLDLGGIAQLREAHRETRGLPILDTIRQDLRYAIRTLRRDVGFTLFAVLIVGLGLGASATIYAIVNALLLRPLPFADADRLVWISNLADDRVSEWTIQVNHLRDLRQQTRAFADLAAYFAFSRPGDTTLTGEGEPERLSGTRVSQNFFTLLGVRPTIGRLFTDEECQWNGPRAVLLTDGLWQRRYGRDPRVIGRAIRLNDASVTVVGVLPASFGFASVFTPGRHVDLFTPFPLTDETNRRGNTLAVVGRLNPFVTIDGATAEFQTLARVLEGQHPDRNPLRPILKPLATHVSGQFRAPLIVLAWAVAVVMLIVCANLANLQLARAASRRREMAVRVALGAGRRRLMAQTLTESLLLSGCGASLGLVVAVAGTRIVASLQTFSLPLLESVTIDVGTVLFLAAMAVLTGVVIGLAPALHVPVLAPQDALKDSARGSTEGRRSLWTRGTLVSSEIALACVLLVAAGLLMRSLLRVLDIDLGFRPDSAIAVRIDPGSRYATPERRHVYVDDALHLVRAIPDVQAAGLADVLPLDGNRSWAVVGKGQVYPAGGYPEGFVRVVSEGYLAALGLGLLAGRDFSADDTPTSDPVAIVNETLARTLWPGQDPLRQIVMTEGPQAGARRVVGVVRDVRHRALERDAGLELYLPMRQRTETGAVFLVVRSTLDAGALTTSIRTALAPIAPDVPANQVRVMQDLVDRAVSPRRFLVVLVAGFAAFAVVLASLGIYAVVAYFVSQRHQEFGIRLALGASPRDVQTRVLRQTLGLAGVGMTVGVAVSLMLTDVLSGLLFGVTAADPATFFGMAVIIGVVSAAAGYMPARRASRLDPMHAIRGQ